MRAAFNAALGLFIASAALMLLQLWFHPLAGVTFVRAQVTLGTLCGVALVIGYVLRERKNARSQVRDGLE